MKLMLVVGARPQIIKSAPIIKEILKQNEIALQLVHTGQHYDFEMSKIFFGELDLPDPVINLGVGSATHAFQTGKIMIGLETAMKDLKPDFVLVPGDTNSTLACALTAAKLNLPVAHIEAGARSYDMRMPEEVNRRLTDHCSRLLFAASENCATNLLREGLSKSSIYISGDTMFDVFMQHMSRVLENDVLNEFGVEERQFGVLTLHRPENVDNAVKLANIMRAMGKIQDLPILFPVHPRTMMRLNSEELSRVVVKSRVRIIDPVGYHTMLSLISKARIIFTDSGGVQKEAFWLHTPCVTIRESTEWVETIQLGANTLVRAEEDDILEKTRAILTASEVKKKLGALPNPYGDGKAAEKIISVLRKL
jgi:UDP-N-acetylglucosamine 2-epimerase